MNSKLMEEILRAQSIHSIRYAEVLVRRQGYFDLVDTVRQLGDAIERELDPLSCEVPFRERAELPFSLR